MSRRLRWRAALALAGAFYSAIVAGVALGKRVERLAARR